MVCMHIHITYEYVWKMANWKLFQMPFNNMVLFVLNNGTSAQNTFPPTHDPTCMIATVVAMNR